MSKSDDANEKYHAYLIERLVKERQKCMDIRQQHPADWNVNADYLNCKELYNKQRNSSLFTIQCNNHYNFNDDKPTRIKLIKDSLMLGYKYAKGELESPPNFPEKL